MNWRGICFDSESNISVLNQGNEPIIRLRFWFCFKAWLHSSFLQLEWVPVFVFRFLRRGLDADEP